MFFKCLSSQSGDTFIEIGFREKERSRMIHNNIGSYAEVSDLENIYFKPLEISDSKACGFISYNAL